MPTTLAQNLARVRREIAQSARAADRDPALVQLVGVTKSVSVDLALSLTTLGVTDLGENRVDDLERKAGALQERGVACRWHFVGHVQRNKAARVARLADVVHSLDSTTLAQVLDRHAGLVGRSLDVYVQVKLAPEETKSGLDPRDLPAVLAAVRDARSLRLAGLMTMAPLVPHDPTHAAARAEEVFERLAELGREHEVAGLSMGMSDDFAIAVRHGSTCVRIGSALFEGVGSEALR